MAEKTTKPARTIPCNQEAEISLLGSILIDAKTADIVVPTLAESDFYYKQNATIFSAIKELVDEAKKIDTVTVHDRLEIKNKLQDVGGLDYLMSLADKVPSAANAEYYVDILRRDSLIRSVIHAGNDISKFGYEAEDGKTALENAEQIIYKISDRASSKSLKHASEALRIALDSINDAQQGKISQDVVWTEVPTFDKMTKGLKPGEIVILAARPSVGKTAFALNIAADACIKNNKNVALFCLEMPSELLAKRMIAYVSGVSLSKMGLQGGLNYKETSKIYSAYNSLLNAGIYIDDNAMNSPSDVFSKCRRLDSEHGLDLIIIDYLQLMTSGSNKIESRQVEVSDMSRKMKVFAKELGCPIILLSQMSRDVEKRPDHTPMMSDLRESGSIEQDADVVMFLNKPSQFNEAIPQSMVILDVKKNRNGSIGEIYLDWNGETTTFSENPNQSVQKELYNSLTSRKGRAGEIAGAGGMSELSEKLGADESKEVASDIMAVETKIETTNMPFGDSDMSDTTEMPFDDENSVKSKIGNMLAGMNINSDTESEDLPF